MKADNKNIQYNKKKYKNLTSGRRVKVNWLIEKNNNFKFKENYFASKQCYLQLLMLLSSEVMRESVR